MQDLDVNQPQHYRFKFTGSGGEYFAIWIVNLLLSILTLGIYSAWAKVRREQYFHRNTLLDEQPFDYTGKPISILIGRVLALVIIGVGSMLQQINVQAALAITVFFAAVYPWVIVRSIKFRARNTRYRNLAFGFTGTTWQATRVYFWIYLALAPLVIASVLAAPALEAMKQDEPAALQWTGPLAWVLGGMLATMLLSAALWPVYQCRIKAFLHSHLRYGNAQGDFDGSAGDFYKAMLRTLWSTLLMLLAIAIIGAVAVFAHAKWLFLLIYPLLLLPQAAYMVYLTNTTYQHAAIGGQRFVSDMQVGGFTLLLFTNLLLLICTLGFAWPWIQVRLARYRCEHMALIAAPAAIAAISGEAAEAAAAFGEEAAEFLDFDISL